MRILKIAEIWKVDGMTSTYAELRIVAISSAMVLLSTTYLSQDMIILIILI